MTKVISKVALAALVLSMVACGTGRQPEQATEVGALTRDTALIQPASPLSDSSNEQSVLAQIDQSSCVFFALGSKTISARGKEKLRQVAMRLKHDENATVTLQGYANDNGSSSFNLAVADSRVGAVATYLRKLGAKPLQIKRKVIGGEKTPVNCRSSECRRLMRRVELIVSSSKSSVE